MRKEERCMERLWTKKENVFAVAFDGEETFTQKNKTTKSHKNTHKQGYRKKTD